MHGRFRSFYGFAGESACCRHIIESRAQIWKPEVIDAYIRLCRKRNALVTVNEPMISYFCSVWYVCVCGSPGRGSRRYGGTANRIHTRGRCFGFSSVNSFFIIVLPDK
jgi:hypothetical protein